MGCKITFIGPSGVILSKDTNLLTEDFQNINPEKIFRNKLYLKDYFNNIYTGENGDSFSEYDIFAYILLNNMQFNTDSVDSIQTLIRNAYLGNKTVLTIDPKIKVVPNKTVEQLQTETRFKGLDFPEDTPPIILVKDNPLISRTYITKITLEGIDGTPITSYMIPDNKESIYKFANMCHRLKALRMLGERVSDEEFVTELGLKDLYKLILYHYNNKNNSAKRSLQTAVDTHISSVEKELRNRLFGYVKDGKTVKSLRALMNEKKKIVEKYDKLLQTTKYQKESSKQSDLEIRDRAQEAVESYRKEIEDTVLKLKDIRDGNFKDEYISKLEHKSNDIQSLKISTEAQNNVVALLEDYIHDPGKYAKFLDEEMITLINSILDRLAGRERVYYNKNKFILAINYKLFRSAYSSDPRRRLTIKIKDVFEMLLRNGWIPAGDKFKDYSNKQIAEIFTEKYLKKLDIYEFRLNYIDGPLFRLQYTPRETVFLQHSELFDGDIRSFSLFQSNRDNYTRYKGYYIYGITTLKDGNPVVTWYASNRILNEYSNPQPFRTKELAMSWVDNNEEKHDSLDGLLHLNNVGESLTIMEIPENATYRKHEILTISDYPAGNVSLQGMTVSSFNNWFNKTMTKRIRDFVISKNSLDSKYKKALFYSNFGNITPDMFYSDPDLENKIITTLNDMLKESYCYIISDSFSDHRKKYVRGVKVSYDDITKVTKVGDEAYYTPDYIILNAITKTLSSNGVPIKLINQEEFDKVLEEKKVPREKREGAKGIYHNGLIYINLQKALATDPLHEYTHILLGILRSNNVTAYNDLLDKVASSDYGKSRLREIQERYPDLDLTGLKEELFSDLYAEYLLGENLRDLNNLFDYSSELVKSDESIFDLNNGVIKFKDDPSLNSIFSRFSSLVRYGLRLSGFKLPIGGATYSLTKDFIEANKKKVQSLAEDTDKAIKEICK